MTGVIGAYYMQIFRKGDLSVGWQFKGANKIRPILRQN